MAHSRLRLQIVVMRDSQLACAAGKLESNWGPFLRERCPTERSVLMKTFRVCSPQPRVGTGNVVSEAEELNF